MGSFRDFLTESLYYHGTSGENAESIMKDGIDPTKYRSGMFVGFYVTPDPHYFDHTPKEVVLVLDLDDAKICDPQTIKDVDLERADPHYRMMSYGYRNHLMQKIAKDRGYGALKNGHEVVIFDKSVVRSIRRMKPAA